MVKAFASGLVHYDLISPNDIGMRFFGICMKNSIKWLIAEQACFYVGATTVPLYDTFNSSTLSQIINQVDLETIVCSPAEFSKISIAAKSCPCLSCIIVTSSNITDSMHHIIANANLSISIMTWNEVISYGKMSIVEPTPPKLTDIATLCYTSGTTGDSKGALITHENILFVVRG